MEVKDVACMKMGGRAFIRGHLIRFDEETWQWIYPDTKKVICNKNERPCVRCGRIATIEGHDACIGTLFREVISACCGHGVESPYIIYK